jgi:putative MATE family efflux protein
MSAPMVISMLVMALYNVVDSIFVALISEDALAAVSLAFPIQSLMVALGIGMSVGMSVVLSKSLGEKNFPQVHKVASNGLFISVLIYLLFMLFGVFGSNWLLRTQTDIAGIVDGGTSYLSIVCIGSLGIFLEFTLERMLISTGKTIYPMITQIVGAVINAVFDPILIFGLFGFPKFGIAGAAISTIASEFCAAGLALFFNLKYNHEVRLSIKKMLPDWKIIKKICAVGLPSVAMQSVVSVMVYGMNAILFMFSSTAVVVFGVYFKLQSFVFMPAYGLNNGMMPIVAYNRGAKKYKRIIKTAKHSFLYVIIIMATGTLIFQLLPERLMMLFNATPDMLRLGVTAIRILGIGFIFAGVSIIIMSILQALGHSLRSMAISFLRMLIIPLPVVWFLAQRGDVNLVWWGFPIAEVVSVMLAVFLMRKQWRIIKAKHENTENNKNNEKRMLHAASGQVELLEH